MENKTTLQAWGLYSRQTTEKKNYTPLSASSETEPSGEKLQTIIRTCNIQVSDSDQSRASVCDEGAERAFPPSSAEHRERPLKNLKEICANADLFH